MVIERAEYQRLGWLDADRLRDYEVVERVWGTKDKSEFIRFIYENQERFFFYFVGNILYCVDEQYRDITLLGQISRLHSTDFIVAFIKPSVEEVSVTIDDNGWIHFGIGEDTIEINKENWGLRVLFNVRGYEQRNIA